MSAKVCETVLFTIKHTPVITVTEQPNLLKIHYPTRYLEEWERIGLSEGTSGPMLMSVDQHRHLYHYESFGTLEHPNTTKLKITLTHNQAFDGEFLDTKEKLEQALNKPPQLFSPDSYRMVFLDVSNYSKSIVSVVTPQRGRGV